LLFALCLKTGTYEELLQQNGAFADFLKTHSLLVGKEGQKTEVCSLTRKEQEVDQQIESSKGFSFLPVKSGGEMEEEMKRRGSRIIQEEETEKGVVRYNRAHEYMPSDASFHCTVLIMVKV
jgi:hypothetical protein